MTELRHREIELQVDTVRLVGVTTPGLRVSFKASKSLKPEPNECEIVVYNLSPDHRNSLTKVKTPNVLLTAGYKGQTTQIFLGQAVHVKHERKGADVITTVTTSDGGDKAQKARVKQSFGPGAKPGDVLRALIKSLDVKQGNAAAMAAKLNAGKAVYLEGVTLSGHAPHELTALCRSAGLEWSIQDGAIQILEVGKAAAKFAAVLDETLLIGTPSISNKNVVQGVTFLQKDFLPGRQVQIKHEFVNGAYRLEKCNYSGDTYAEDWYVDFEAKGPPLK